MTADFRTDIHALLPPLQRLQAQIRDAVVAAAEQAERAQSDNLSGIAEESEGDTIYAIDKVSEEVILSFFAQEIAPHAPVVLIAEGLHTGKVVLPEGTPEEEAVWRVIVDPIDGTRGIMYQKRSAWVLTGVAPNRGEATNLQDIELAIQTEIPTLKQHLCDVVWAIRGEGVTAERFNRLTGQTVPLSLRPSRADTIAHGFTTVARFFPGVREELSAIDEEIVRGALGPVQPGKAHCFEDQYASTGGQLYELMSGHDRFIMDIRPLMAPYLTARGLPLGLCCHPYDLCTELIARELGVIVHDAEGRPAHDLLAVEPDISWVGYANEAIRDQIEPLLQEALQKRGLLPTD